MSRKPPSGSERRRFPRFVIEAPLTAVRQNTPMDDRRHAIGLRVLNVSRGGLAAICPEFLQDREPLMVFFPPLGPRKGQDTQGTVTRCEQHGGHYTVGIAFEEPWPEREAISPD
ncbi:MAG TPA: PilZ domain-containing protein [Phycisphaerae bacterium]|nr:PilZ domain-containing protein [Phycisphaerae bacterium]